jgi:PKD repeat protein
MQRFRIILPLLCLLGFVPAASAQHVFLDTNGDGINDGSDHLNPDGPTDVDIWFVTDRNRDGSPAGCASDPTEPLTINSYEIALVALNGPVEFGPMRNRLPFSGPAVCFAGYEDTTNTSVYHNGWGYRDIMPPGRYLVATLTVRPLDDGATLAFVGRSPLQPVDMTSFGTKCTGTDWDNTHVLGEDFFDASGIGGILAKAGGPYRGVAGRPISFDGRGSRDPDGLPLSYGWAFDDGGTATGAIATHTFVEVGAHHATLTVSNGSQTASDRAEVTVYSPTEPVAVSGGPYRARIFEVVPFDASASFDPDGDPLSYAWTFGDGGYASGARPHYIYGAIGTYEVRLTVSDGIASALDVTTATIDDPQNGTPRADAGGPYVGIVGRWIQFNGTRSSDPDCDPLAYSWDFGDGIGGSGPVPAHAYRAEGNYPVTLVVSDRHTWSRAGTMAMIDRGFAARAFFDGGRTVVNVDGEGEFVIVRVEPEESSFRPFDVDVDVVHLAVGTVDGGTATLQAAGPALETEDTDGNGVAEFAVRFARSAFRDLVEADRVRGRTRLELVGGLYRGGSYVGAFEGTFVRSESFQLTITPNPFNPQTRVVLLTRTSGPVTARLFDIRGRLVKSILREVPMPAGRHELAFDGRDDAGVRLASGVYLLQVNGPDGARTGRVVVAK